jgi:hypothetical protein
VQEMRINWKSRMLSIEQHRERAEKVLRVCKLIREAKSKRNHIKSMFSGDILYDMNSKIINLLSLCTLGENLLVLEHKEKM